MIGSETQRSSPSHRPELLSAILTAPCAQYPDRLKVGDSGNEILAQVLIPPSAVRETKGGVYNPIFDVTPAELITAIATEKYIVMEREGEANFDFVREAKETV
ncbi:hypothetical protein OG21DRAFT_1514609 [Imleria badia]|nr:hypothetical protein OG21DRAFT_1514609 [Imleria badia]